MSTLCEITFGYTEKDELLARISKLERTVASMTDELVKSEKKNARLRATKFFRFNDEEAWIWNDDMPNYIESIVCPIVIHRDDLTRIAQHGFNGIENGVDDV
jgi:hypothetical protein